MDQKYDYSKRTPSVHGVISNKAVGKVEGTDSSIVDPNKKVMIISNIEGLHSIQKYVAEINWIIWKNISGKIYKSIKEEILRSHVKNWKMLTIK